MERMIVQHLHTKDSGKKPSPDSIMDGELAINYVANGETLFIKNSEGAIAEFKDDKYYQKQLSEKTDKTLPLTYSELVSLRDNSQLIPGQQYRITDYTCTTTQENTRSAGHQFDIIVKADSENKLNEEANAIQHTKDDIDYFANSDLSAWRLWYCLDNDTERFAWADGTNGKGVIYRMIDEWNNDVPYDFKNIQFYRLWDEDTQLWSIRPDTDGIGVPCYTFSSSGVSSTTEFTDLSVMSLEGHHSSNNFIGEYNDLFRRLTYNCFLGFASYNTLIGSFECTLGGLVASNTINTGSNIIIGDESQGNTFDVGCSNITLGGGSFVNSFGKYCQEITIGNVCGFNSFGAANHHINLGDYFSSNTFGNYCAMIQFASDSSASTKYNYYQNNHFGDGCAYLVFKGTETASDSQQVQNYNFSQGLQGTDSSYLTIDGKRNRAYETYISKDTDGTIKESVIAEKLDKVIEISYNDLVTLRGSSKLVPGQQYRITDYTCTTTQANTKSAGHVFDIIVTADDESTLNEVARAIKHEGDTYFANSDLNAWKIWYCLDNDTNRFAWADSANGKGVIYRMIDEFNNDVPYDFKNIQFYRQWNSSMSLWSTISSDTTGVPCYTFSSKGNSSTTSFTDMSLSISNKVYSNVIKEYIDYNSKKQKLNNTCFFGDECYSNSFGNNCYSNTFGNNCQQNTVGNYCDSNTFGNSCYNNTFGNNCDSNTFGNKCYSNTFGNYCGGNTFGNNCYSNTFDGYCGNNTFGNNCYSNTFDGYCGGNTFGNDFNSNTFGNNCDSNTFGNSCYRNNFGNYCGGNTFGNYIQESQFGDGVQYFSITTQQMTTSPTSSYAKSYIRWLIVENGVRYVNAYVTGSTSSSLYCQNVRICLGIQGVNSNNRKTFDITSCINSKLNNVYQPENSQTTSV